MSTETADFQPKKRSVRDLLALADESMRPAMRLRHRTSKAEYERFAPLVEKKVLGDGVTCRGLAIWLVEVNEWPPCEVGTKEFSKLEAALGRIKRRLEAAKKDR